MAPLPTRLAAAILLGLAALVPAAPALAEGPAWDSLSATQRQILAPLQRDWASIEAARKEKWLEVAARYPSMPPSERQRLQNRMSAWARMTPAERTRARQQYQETRQLPAEEKRARWQAYQSLTEDERRELAQRVRPPAKGGAVESPSPAAPADSRKSNVVVPLSPAKARLVAPSVVNTRPGATTTTLTTPATPPLHHQPGLPKIAATPGFVDKSTLLPQRGPQGAAVRSEPASAPARRP